MKCNHISKVVKWEYRLVDGQMDSYVSLYGCTKCEATQDTRFVDDNEIFVDHSKCHTHPCFGCKAKNLQLSVGAARHDGVPTAKAHDRELQNYYDATAQGIEPVSTKQKDIDAAVKISNEVGKAFDGDTMGFKN